MSSSFSIFAHSDLLGKTMQVCSLRNEIISNNIANVDTPGFKKGRVTFEDSLRAEIAKTGYNSEKIDISKINPVVKLEDEFLHMRMDGNNIDIEQENVALYKNSVMSDVMANSIINHHKILTSAINIK